LSNTAHNGGANHACTADHKTRFPAGSNPTAETSTLAQ
jgi:hypothetical protein